ncbi:conserved hypothetical protein [Thiomonas arsenitoxydans]|uniref:Uncharacterized protein n=1 Tax=Thiomonas arsenitoxydans (strain DSM 22701 / CIP 110005 / 3As) TaxID=426114 RepID=D6CKC9_THIA3|nr:hypothetical protein [Thiomonas arsenitoxydans]CAZ86842.1 conserved hypothetical protein [Thiomonas arsenitoxydans]CQR28217.1 conserved hypothetical protein [Thiomonas arsenitoxydans]CQR30686.1 conserved hypothetical protein [Thiomonas arsenitoxydans]CQR31719.1 conserved hypothetical protein [Thiomonas arsenitoxydans]CQR31923.1 conserved hypothetical protein [Thiomonas arsenitoxydans]
MKKYRAPDLTQEHIATALDTLDTWRGKLTWDLLLDSLEAAWGYRYSRFTLASYPEVANAFAHRKDALKGTLPVSRGTPTDERVRAAIEQAERFKAKAERLEAENSLLLEQFVTWALNAESKGVTMDMLNKPLPKPDRDRSKVVK